MSLPSADNISSENTCPDSLVVYKKVTVPGVQQTDLDGNVIENLLQQYQVYLLSSSKNVLIDSIQIGTRVIRDSKTTLLKEKSVELQFPGKKIELVAATKCSIYQILAEYSTNENSGKEPQPVILYYSKDGLKQKLSTTNIGLLPQMVTE